MEKSFGKETRMVATLIVVCSRCGGLLMAAVDQKTRTCPYCGSRVDVQKAKRIASAENAFVASEMLRELKSRKGFNR
jgi:DNA-directed RNA polymerase subunit RPC12/RpoP